MGLVTIASKLQTGWWSIELPIYRPHPDLATYSLFSYEELPPLPAIPDLDSFGWLQRQPAQENAIGTGDTNAKNEFTSKLAQLTRQVGFALPASFTTFMESPELHQAIRSCTDCYLDLAHFAAPVRASLLTGDNGFLIHFLADSQWCLHWYLYVNENGEHFVVASPNAYGYVDDMDDDDLENMDDHGQSRLDKLKRRKVKLHQKNIRMCAPAFSAFIYRFWLENEIWFALAEEGRTLTAIEQAYVDQYSRSQQ